jgi:hypothetical protein
MVSKPLLNKTLTVLLTLFLSASLSIANAEKGRKGPPKEAFTACASQTEEGSACSFSNRDGETIEGTCKVPRRSEESLVCAPSHGKHNGKPHKKRDEY